MINWRWKSLGHDLQPRTRRGSSVHRCLRCSGLVGGDGFLQTVVETVLTTSNQFLPQMHVSTAKERGQVIPLQRHRAPIQNFIKCGKRKCHQAEKQSGLCSTFPLASYIGLDSNFRQVIVRVYLLKALRARHFLSLSLCW
jgi:hypothetical protein